MKNPHSFPLIETTFVLRSTVLELVTHCEKIYVCLSLRQYNNGGPLSTVVTPQLGRSAHVHTWGYEVWNCLGSGNLGGLDLLDWRYIRNGKVRRGKNINAIKLMTLFSEQHTHIKFSQ